MTTQKQGQESGDETPLAGEFSAVGGQKYFLLRATHGTPKQRAISDGVAAHLLSAEDSSPICGAKLGIGWENFGHEVTWPDTDLEAGKRALCQNCYRIANDFVVVKEKSNQ